MTTFAWRIGSDTPAYSADDMGGEGAALTGGRWNSKGKRMVYAAENVSLAAWETKVHEKGLPLNRYLVKISIPDPVWNARQESLSPAVGWDAIPHGLMSIQHGDDWLASLGSALLVVPSVVIPDEHCVLINPEHPDAKQIAAEKTRRFLYDPRA